MPRLHLDDCDDRFDGVLVRCYGYPANGRQQLPVRTPMHNKFVGGARDSGIHAVVRPIRLRNIKVGRPAMADRVRVGEAVCYDSHIFIRNVEDRRTNTHG